MNQPRKVIAGAIFLGLVLFCVILGSRRKEPVYEGRTLSSWLDHHVGSSAAIPPYGSEGWKKADVALRAIGTNSIPTLVAMLKAKDPPGIISKFAARHAWRELTQALRSADGRKRNTRFEFLGQTARRLFRSWSKYMRNHHRHRHKCMPPYPYKI
jgi:hypothetical protein